MKTDESMVAPMKPIGITMGDPAGIGPEIIVKLLTQDIPWPCVIYGDSKWIERTARWLKIDCEIRSINNACEVMPEPSHAQTVSARSNRQILWVIDTFTVQDSLPIGQVTAQAGQSAYASVSRAIEDALS